VILGVTFVINMAAEFYRRNLPHWHPRGAALSLTARLHGSLPQNVVQDWLRECALETERLGENPESGASHQLKARQFVRFDDLLARDAKGPRWLAEPTVARLVLEALYYPVPTAYELLAATVMSNHWHAVVVLVEAPAKPFFRTMQQTKAHIARQANKLLGRSGEFWARETYDHVIRNPWERGLSNAVNYVLNNPVKAGLCATWQEWPHTWVAPEWAP
jgi:putative transposase